MQPRDRRQFRGAVAEIGAGRAARRGQPACPLHVGEDVDLVVNQSRAVATGRVEHFADFGQGSRHVGPRMNQLQIGDFLPDRLGFQGRSGYDDPRRIGHLQQRKTVARRAAIDDLLGQLLGLLKVRCFADFVGHGIGRVDDQNSVRASAGAENRAARSI